MLTIEHEIPTVKYLTKETAKLPLSSRELEGNKARRTYPKVRKNLECIEEKVQMTTNELFNWHLSPTNIIGCEHDNRFITNSFKLTIQKPWLCLIFFQNISLTLRSVLLGVRVLSHIDDNFPFQS